MKPRAGLFVLAALIVSTTAAAPSPALHFETFARTGIRLTDAVWTGTQFLYVENTTNAIFAGDTKGGAPHPFAALPKIAEETRCIVAPGGRGFPRGQIYNELTRVSPRRARDELSLRRARLRRACPPSSRGPAA